MSPTKRTTDTRRDRSRQAIITATSKVLSAKGLSEMTVEDILKEAGVARATFYSHFTDKNDVTGAVVEQMFQRAENLYASFHEIAEVSHEQVTQWLSNAFEQWTAYQAEVSSLVRDFAALFRSPQFVHLEGFAEVLVGDGSKFACDRHTALLRARLLIVQLERAMLDTVSGAWPYSKDELIEQLALVWVNTLQPPHKA